MPIQRRVEKRRFERVPVNLPVEFTVGANASRARAGRGRDISVGGMFIETAEPAVFGESVIVTFRVAFFQEAVLVPAVVRWMGQAGMGVQFGLLGARETHAITDLMRTRSETHPAA